MGVKHFGARVTRFEDPALLAGRGRFVDDIALPGALNACFVRSPHGHAKFRSIDATAALAMPGVHAVLTAADLPGPMRTSRIPMILPVADNRTMRTAALPRAIDEVNYAGQAVAVVIADSRHLAEDAAAMVAVDFEVLPAASDAREAVAPGAPLAHTDIPRQRRAGACRRHTATSTLPSPARRMCSKRKSGRTAAAAWRWKRARCWRATSRRPTC